jgi:alkylresorcinol/alkylpyrone synthase
MSEPPSATHSPVVPRARLLALATALPPHVVTQGEARELARLLFRDVLNGDRERLLDVFEHTGIERRHFAMPLGWYADDHAFGEKNALYVEHAVRLGAEVATRALDAAGLRATDVDHLMFVSSTGITAPSVDSRLANVLGLRGDFRRTPLWGLGCAGGAAGLARARDFALAEPGARVLLVALELCGLTFQRNDLSKRNLVAASLFADGAAAAVVVAGPHPLPVNGTPSLALHAASSTWWPDTLDIMGWEVDGDGLHVVFARDIPALVRERVRPGVEAFLAREGLSLDRVQHVVAHPGGSKVLAAFEDALSLPPTALGHARDVLREHGNMSSPTCLFVLERFVRAHAFAPGHRALLAALGPGFAAEYLLLDAEHPE